MYSRAFFIRTIARLNYPRVYSRQFNDLRALSTSGIPELQSSRGIGARSPHRQRVAIKRHEFHPQSYVAPATPVFEADRGSVSASASPSLLAPARGTTARSAVSVINGSPTRSSVPTRLVSRRSGIASRRSFTNPRHGVAFMPRATSSHDRSCVLHAHPGAVTRSACSATRAAAPWQTPRYACLLEAV